MNVKAYDSALAFKSALEHRLRAVSSSGADLNRRRQLLVFNRFLARITQVLGDAVVLKGGLVIELRLERARTTKDVDLRMVGTADEALERMQSAGRLELGDFVTFEVVPDPHHPAIQNDGMNYDGYRFRAKCQLAGKLYGSLFGVDVAFGDPLVAPPDTVVQDNFLQFAGVSPSSVRLYPIGSHIAEKLHAYTMPRKRPNSRVKDLPDIALLALTGPIESQELRRALDMTFEFRATHALPGRVPAPDSTWVKPYAAIAAKDELPWKDLNDVIQAVSHFLDPILDMRAQGRWDSDSWTWRAET